MTHFKVKSPVFVPGIFQAMDKWFQDEFQQPHMNLKPAVNIIEKDKHYELSMVAPGLQKNDFQISLDDNTLTVAYNHQEEKSEEKPNYVRREYTMKSFKRSFHVGDHLNLQEVSANYENGVLTIMIPKAENKESSVKNIQVN